MIRVCVAGITGWTGGPIAAAIAGADDLELVAGLARAEADLVQHRHGAHDHRAFCR